MEPPVYRRTRMAAVVAPRLEAPPGSAAKPPSGFWRAVAKAAVCDRCSTLSDWASAATGTSQRPQQTPRRSRIIGAPGGSS